MNLLPEKNKILLKKEYFKRVFVTLGIFLIFAVLAAIAILAPAGVFIFSRKNDFEKESAASAKSADKIGSEKSITEASQINSRLKILENKWSNSDLSILIKKIIDSKSAGVKIKFLSYNNGNATEGSVIAISGEAARRQDLFAFESGLKKEFGEDKVASPISNMIKEKDLIFTLTLKIKNEK